LIDYNFHKRLLFLSVSGAGDLSRGTLLVVQHTDIHVMEMMPSGRYEITRRLINGGGK